MTNTLTKSIVEASRLTQLERCCDCGRALRDPVSVELGIGPTCRKHGAYNMAMAAVQGPLRALAKATIKAISAAQTGVSLLPHCDVLRTLGFDRLANRIEPRLASVHIVKVDDGRRFAITFDYNPSAYYAFKRIGGWRACADKRGGPVCSVPVEARGQICTVLKMCFAEELVYGEHGLALIRVGWRRNSVISMDLLLEMATVLGRAESDLASERGAQIQSLAEGAGTIATTPDWRPETPLPEDYYAV